jgi:hypothetical protein
MGPAVSASALETAQLLAQADAVLARRWAGPAMPRRARRQAVDSIWALAAVRDWPSGTVLSDSRAGLASQPVRFPGLADGWPQQQVRSFH